MQRPSAWSKTFWQQKRDLELPRESCSGSTTPTLSINCDLGYLPQGTDEAEILSAPIAERYERRQWGITPSPVFSNRGKIYSNPMATAPLRDRIVHRALVLKFAVPGFRIGLVMEDKKAG